MVEAIGRQLDRCDVCGKKTHKVDLVRTQVEFLAAAGSNYLSYSSYNATGWSTSGLTDKGVISIGPYADRARVSISDGNTATEILGSQTWSGDGHLYTASSVDVSSWTSLVFAADVGPYHRSDNRDLTIILSTCDASATVEDTLGTWAINSDTRVWATINIASMTRDSSALYLRLDVTPGTGEYWWADRFQLEKNATRPGTFVPTSGSTVDRVDTPSVTMRKVCPSCRERVLSKTNRYGRGVENRTDDPIAVHNQEF